MEYPTYLLPQKNYKIIDFDNVNLGLRYLVRHTENTDLKDLSGKLKAELVAIQSDHLRDYSTNLLGIFQLKDLRWQWLKGTECTTIWNPGVLPLYPTEKDVQLVAEDRGYFFLKIAKFHGINFPTKVEHEGEHEVACRVVHTPLKSNFWHCSLRWLCNGEESLHWNKGRINRMKAHIRSYISQKAEFTEPVHQAIDPATYLAS